MKSQALFISTYPEQSRIARELADELGIKIHIFEGGLLKGGHLYALENEHNYDVIIALGAVGSYVEKFLKKPVVYIPIPLKVMIETIMTAKSYGDPVTLLAYKDSTSIDFKTIAGITPALQCNFGLYSSPEEIEFYFNEVTAFKSHTIVYTGNCFEKKLEEREGNHSLRFITLKVPREDMRLALSRAKAIITLKQEEQLRTERINGILEHAVEGVVLLDKNACITDANEQAALLSQMPVSRIVGRNILDASLPQLFRCVYGNGASVAGSKVQCDGGSFVVNRINILLDEQCDETIITFYRSATDGSGHSQNIRRRQGSGLVARHVFEDIIGDGKAMQRTILQARRFGQTEAPILVEGETGTGKELLVQSIHNASARKDGPFVVVNCAALPETLLESELFGYEEGAFTGARKGGKKGFFEVANGGTIFLDEISESSLAVQSRLLRVLQEREVMRVGSSNVLQINARIVAATNKNLHALVQAGTFKKDLYFRLRRLKLTIPPLRERKEDILPLARHFIQKNPFGNREDLLRQIEACSALLMHHTWAGNVRELEHLIERLAILYDPDTDLLDLIVEQLADEDDCVTPMSGQGREQILVNVGPLKEMQRDIMLKLLLRTRGNKTHLADILNISRVTVWNMLK